MAESIANRGGGGKVDLTKEKNKTGAVLATKFFTRRSVSVEAVAKTF